MKYDSSANAYIKMLTETRSPSKIIRVASDFGYNVEEQPDHMKYNHEQGKPVFVVTHNPEGGDLDNPIGRFTSINEVEKAILTHAKKHEPEMGPVLRY